MAKDELTRLFDSLWKRYRARVEYARRYEALLAERGATFRNDHVAFRTIAYEKPAAGIFSVSRLFERLGYRAAACYDFPDKKLSAVHFQHPDSAQPKLFVSELRAWELSAPSRKIIDKAFSTYKPSSTALLTTLPWALPEKKDVAALDRESQYGAWVLLHGYEVNHFTASIDAHGVESLSDIEKTVAALRAAGIPMKAEIEGARGSKLRQSSTEAVNVDVKVKDRGRASTMPWTYAYFELAERPVIDGKRFEGFLGGQATHLFEMTRRRAS
jgi:hypothetical protein